MAQAVGAKFNITEVLIPHWDKDSIESIAVVSELVHVHITQQEGALPELKLETVSDYMGAFAGDFIELFLCLQRASRAWSILFFEVLTGKPWPRSLKMDRLA